MICTTTHRISRPLRCSDFSPRLVMVVSYGKRSYVILLKTYYESIFFMVFQIANRMIEMLWNFPNIPQKSVAVYSTEIEQRKENRLL